MPLPSRVLWHADRNLEAVDWGYLAVVSSAYRLIIFNLYDALSFIGDLTKKLVTGLCFPGFRSDAPRDIYSNVTLPTLSKIGTKDLPSSSSGVIKQILNFCASSAWRSKSLDRT